MVPILDEWVFVIVFTWRLAGLKIATPENFGKEENLLMRGSRLSFYARYLWVQFHARI